MFTKVSVLVPTRERIERLRTLITSFDVTTGNGPDAELVFRVDEDDRDTLQFLCDWGGHKIVVGPRLGGYNSLPVFFNEMFAASSGDVLMCGNDDMVFKTVGWPAAILAEANKHPDGLFNVGVKAHNETHYPFSTVSRKVAEALGFIWDPTIFWGDIYLRDVMAAFDRCVMLPEVEIAHEWMGFTPDRTFLAGRQHEIWERDPTYWAGTHARAVEAAVARLKEQLA
jgi:hypothetical protein